MSPRSSLHARAVAAWLAGAALLLVGPAAAQGDGREPVPEVDPYTGGDRDLMHAAGIVSFGPFLFGDGNTSEQAERVLGGVPAVWAETAHFRIGSTLDGYDWPNDKDERKRLQAELKRLGTWCRRLRGKRKVKRLDPWLRLHLYALRLEDVYQRFCEVMGVENGEFPATTVNRLGSPTGPYLGQPEKFSVLLCDKRSEYGRYAATYLNWNAPSPLRHRFPKTGIVFFGTAEEFLTGTYENDLALHCQVVGALAQNFVSFYGGGYDLAPFFLSEGVGHWFSREIDERFPSFTGRLGATLSGKDDPRWERRVRARAKNGAFPPMAEILAWTDPEALRYSDHMVLWSRIDHLIRGVDGGLGRLVRAVRQPAVRRAPPGSRAYRDAFVEALGQSPEDYDVAWAAWVADEYPAR